MVMFFCSLEVETLTTHSGYNLPWNANALQHDWHHFFYTENYGPTGVLDWWHGSNKIFKGWLKELAKKGPVSNANGSSPTVFKKAREDLAKGEVLGINPPVEVE
jgi:fatty acid hydroxylase domain-containing protein 2